MLPVRSSASAIPWWILLALLVWIPQAPAQLSAPGKRPIRIMPLGDSITLGSSQPSWVAGGYRAPLLQLLNASGYNIAFVGSQTNNADQRLGVNVSHEGHGGYTTSDLLQNLDADSTVAGDSGGYWLTGIPHVREPVFPDVILLLAGVNDLGVKRRIASEGLAGLDSLLNKIAELRPYTWILVSTLPPYIGTNYPSREGNQKEFNASLPGLVGRHSAAGHRVALCDLRSTLSEEKAAGLLCFDGVHPNKAGYELIARAWFEAIQRLLVTTKGLTAPPGEKDLPISSSKDLR